ncbi:MAG: molybdopterin-guanine dinucleotide biosynthesis protein MobB [Defluviitaleaceae bacterium]|nr:molybdopterin-guanine dinucleotide biosynthesis protein MobB [Defluviitaleaceae bacterium]
MRAFAICGITNSGKTTTTEHIIRELMVRGYRVGSVKYIHCDGFEMDADPETDTRRHRTAGSQIVSAHAKGETSIMFPNRISTEKLLNFYQEECDWVVLEGVSDILVPTIVTAHTEEDLRMKWSDMVFCVSGRISSEIDEYYGVPAIDATKDIIQMVDHIEDRVYHWQPDFNRVRYLINSLQYPAHTWR